MSTQHDMPIVPTLNASPEKPAHYHYLKGFRVQPCALFKQHQCQQHRPYTCFYWHFGNQRRRPPVRRRDGTFNYSADIYCSKYDENTGVCPEGDECALLHRVAGDVERKYHVRYYKTALCVHATDARGQCSKNGAHCAFAHNHDDLRMPVFDIRELQGQAEHRDRTSFVVEDPVWQEQGYVLSCYKTEPCRKPARLCRQGYACPYYHNAKDRRRPPAVNAYRSTPCPNSKMQDEWTDPLTHCEAGDSCIYCHTRTEQQFHPEIYKSSKCNDMIQHDYCPRGPFCAFAHTDEELHAERKTFVPPKADATTCSPVHRNMLPQVVDMPECPVPPSGSAVGGHIHRDVVNGNVTCGSAPNSYSAILKTRSTRLPTFDRLANSPTSTWAEFERPSSRVRTTSLNVGVELPTSVDIASPARNRASSFGNESSFPGMPFFEDTSSEEHLPPIREDDATQYTFGSFEPEETTRTPARVIEGTSADPFFHMSGSYGSSSDADELAKARDELQSHRAKLVAWEEGLKQARHACEAWRREAENNKQKAMQIDVERRRMMEERDVALAQVAQLRGQMRASMPMLYGSSPTQLDVILNQMTGSPLPPTGPMCGRCGRVAGSGGSGCAVCHVNPLKANY